MQRVWLVALIALLVYLTYQVFAPFLSALAWGMVLTIIFYPVHARILQRLGRPNLSALISTLLLTFIIIVPALVVGAAFTRQAVQAARQIQADRAQGKMPLERVWRTLPVETVFNWLDEYGYPKEEVQQTIRSSIQRAAGFLAAQMGYLAANILVFLFNLFVTLFAAFYLLRDGPSLLDRLRRVLPLNESQREGLIYIAHNVLYASVMSSIVVAAVQGLLGGLLFWALGIQAPVLWGVVMAFLSLLPLLGAWLVWVPAAISFALDGSYVKAIVLLAVGAGVIGIVDNVVRPLLISGRAQLNGLLVFISVLGGIAAFGMVGIVLGPILVALGNAALEVYSELGIASESAPSTDETPP